MAFQRCHIVMFEFMKFCAGIVVGFWLEIYFLPILKAEKELDRVLGAILSDSALRCGTFTRDLPSSGGLDWGDGPAIINAARI